MPVHSTYINIAQVPEDLQQILNDSSLFSGSADITTKEILKRYADIGKSSASALTPGSDVETGVNGTMRSKESRGSAPMITRVDENPFQDSTGWQAESSVRPTVAKTEQSTPPQETHRFYASPANGSKDSFGLGGSPQKQNKHKDQGPPYGPQDGPMGMA